MSLDICLNSCTARHQEQPRCQLWTPGDDDVSLQVRGFQQTSQLVGRRAVGRGVWETSQLAPHFDVKLKLL